MYFGFSLRWVGWAAQQSPWAWRITMSALLHERNRAFFSKSPNHPDWRKYLP